VFQIGVTSPPLNGFIFFSQVVAIEYSNNVSTHAMVAITITPWLKFSLQVTVFGI